MDSTQTAHNTYRSTNRHAAHVLAVDELNSARAPVARSTQRLLIKATYAPAGSGKPTPLTPSGAAHAQTATTLCAGAALRAKTELCCQAWLAVREPMCNIAASSYCPWLGVPIAHGLQRAWQPNAHPAISTATRAIAHCTALPTTLCLRLKMY